MSGARTERAERELEEATGSARARALCARAARGSSEPPPGGRGGGGAGECVRVARAREGLPSPTAPEPNLVLGWGGGVFCLSLVSPPLRPSLPALPPFRPSTRLLPSSADCHSGVLFPGRVTSGVKELRLGAGPGRAALIVPRSRVGDTPVGRGRRNPPVPEWASSREICSSFVALLHRPCSFPDFYEIQIPTYPEPTSSDLERFTERRVHGVGLCNLKTLLPFFLICTVGMIFYQPISGA